MKIHIYYASAGYGHQKVAEVIARTFWERGLTESEVKIEDALTASFLLFRKLYPNIYFHAVKALPDLWGWFYEFLDRPSVYTAIRPSRYFLNTLFGGKLLQKARGQQPEVILCTHFYPAQLFSEAKRRGELKAKIITVMTDFYPHTFWVNEGTDLYWVMSEEGARALRERGVPAERIQVGGIPVERRFQPAGRKTDLLKKWDFSNSRLTLLLTSGSFGLGPQTEILTALKDFSERVQCFVVCGNNYPLKQALEKMDFAFPVHIFGFVDFMPELMEASDLMIAKPGGATSSESLVKGIPMIIFHPIPGQEMRNAHLLKENHAVFFMEKAEQIKVIVKTLLDQPELLQEKRKITARLAKPNAADDLVSYVLKSL